MRPYVVLRYLGLVLLINGAFLLLSTVVSVVYGDTAFRPLLYSALVCVLFGVFPMVFVPSITRISKEEALGVVVGGWVLSCVYGMLPYLLWGGEFSLTNAWFESVSGFTTTGSSILRDIEALPNGLLFWRAATHWIGGLGIVLFMLSVVPAMGMPGTMLYRTEMSSLAQDSIRRNARNALRVLMTVYLGLTLAQTVALLIAGMSLFDAVTHSFATIATGGFSTKNASIAYYNSVGIETIVMVFMVLSGMHFGLLHAAIFEGRLKALWRSSAFRYYLAALAIAVGLTTVLTYGSAFASWPDAFRRSAFQVLSVGTSTGFANADSSVWPPLAQMILMIMTLQCACVGSTSGGIKADRLVMFGKAVRKQLKQLQHPRGIFRARIDGEGVSDDVLAAGVLYIGLYLLVVLVGGVILTLLGVDALSAFSGTIATTGNVGPGLGSVGSVGNYAGIPDSGKWVLTGTMLLGRLEIFGLIMVLLPGVEAARRRFRQSRFAGRR